MTLCAECCGHTMSTHDHSQSVLCLRDGGSQGNVICSRSRRERAGGRSEPRFLTEPLSRWQCQSGAHPATNITRLLLGEKPGQQGHYCRANPRPCCGLRRRREPPSLPAEAATGLREGRSCKGLSTEDPQPSPSLSSPVPQPSSAPQAEQQGVSMIPILSNGVETKKCWHRCLVGERR